MRCSLPRLWLLRTHLNGGSVPDMPPPHKRSRHTLAINVGAWKTLNETAGLRSEKEQAAHLGIDRGTLNRVRNGRAAPGPEFIAAVRRAYPDADLDMIFQVVPKPTTEAVA